ncbi:MAG: hypothetical protein US42_C0016G0008 [Candidatus Magasanikbacteria bacterium GW2011_GWC2_37_14]|uniref:Homeodomain phBC6A51-type domain-containing protein n=1 Tax=Candidatus Magasanikbacteria bacterium GW2011_GWC2_37_14 TaxID=1619046 RepID=A0A0G0G7C5_9BACT|nr:MAG: hypothetical protein US42_C0016G0008 [Candidatus Magasanikbacteria bacterium GW2011_GWC2_37_14]
MSKAKIKKKMIELASDNPVVSSLCHKFDISRATFYRWFNEDDAFKEEFNKSKIIGITGMCDVAESRIISLVKGSNEYVALNASKYILDHNSPRYKEANQGYIRIKLENKLREAENEKKELIEKTIEGIQVFIQQGKQKEEENEDKIKGNQITFVNFSKSDDKSTNIQDSKSETDKPSVEPQENQTTSNNSDLNSSNQDNSRDNSI